MKNIILILSLFIALSSCNQVNENPSSNFYYQRGTVGKVEFRTAPQHEAQAKDSHYVNCRAFSVWSWRSNIDQ